MNQKELFDQFAFDCDFLKNCRNVVQNKFEPTLTKDQASDIINDFEMALSMAERNLRDTVYKVKEFIWNQAQ